MQDASREEEPRLEDSERHDITLLNTAAALPLQAVLVANQELSRLILAKLQGEEPEDRLAANFVFVDIPHDPDRAEVSEALFESLGKILGVGFPRLTFQKPKLRELRLLDAAKLNPSYFESAFRYKLGHAERVLVSDCFRCTLLAIDLDKLEPAKWLNDAVINFFIEVYKSPEFIAASKEFFPDTLPSEGFVLFNTYFSAYLDGLDKALLEHDGDVSVVERALQELITKKIGWLVTRRRTDLTLFSVILIPYFRKSHWNMYVVLDFDMLWRAAKDYLAISGSDPAGLPHVLEAVPVSCFALDSLYQNPNDHRLNFLSIRCALQAVLVGIINQAFGLELPATLPLITHLNFNATVVRTMLQNNAVDCGPALLQNIENIIQMGFPALRQMNAEHFMLGETHSNLQRKRTHLVEFILALERKEDIASALRHYISKKAACA